MADTDKLVKVGQLDAVADAVIEVVSDTNERLDALEGGGGDGISASVRSAIFAILEKCVIQPNMSADPTGDTPYDLSAQMAIIEDWATVTVTAITLSANTLTFTASGSQTLTATLTPSDASETVTWTSSNTSVATVNNGVVTAVGDGSCTITASVGNVIATCAVSVSGSTYTTYDYATVVTSNSANCAIDTGIVFTPSASVYNVEFRFASSGTAGTPMLGGRATSGTTGANSAFAIWRGSNLIAIHVFGLDKSISVADLNSQINTVKWEYNGNSVSTLTVNGTVNEVGTLAKTSITNNTKSFVLLGQNKNGTLTGMYNDVQLGEVKIYDPADNALLYDFVPAKKNSNSQYGFWEKINNVFYGKTSSYVTCGNWSA